MRQSGSIIGSIEHSDSHLDEDSPTIHQVNKIGSCTLVDIRRTAESIVEISVKLPANGKNGAGRSEDEEGGILTFFSKKNCEMIEKPEVVGFFNKENKDNYCKLSKEQGRRLFRYPQHLSSFQSRNPSEEKFGGAISARHLIVSFKAGFNEFCNEAICLVLALHLEWMTREEAEKIVKISKNKIFKPLHEKFNSGR